MSQPHNTHLQPHTYMQHYLHTTMNQYESIAASPAYRSKFKGSAQLLDCNLPSTRSRGGPVTRDTTTAQSWTPCAYNWTQWSRHSTWEVQWHCAPVSYAHASATRVGGYVEAVMWCGHLRHRASVSSTNHLTTPTVFNVWQLRTSTKQTAAILHTHIPRLRLTPASRGPEPCCPTARALEAVASARSTRSEALAALRHHLRPV